MVCVQPGGFCPAKPGPLTHTDQISSFNDSSRSYLPSCLTLPEELYKFVATSVHLSFHLPSVSLWQPREKCAEKRLGQPPVQRNEASSSEECRSCIQRLRIAAAAKEQVQMRAITAPKSDFCRCCYIILAYFPYFENKLMLLRSPCCLCLPLTRRNSGLKRRPLSGNGSVKTCSWQRTHTQQ
jgi:hypothetical protein